MNQQYILFENFLTENYYVNSLTEEEISWIYENEFLPKLNDKEYLNEKLRLLDILGGAAAGALTGALTGFGIVPGGIAGAIGGLTATYPEGKELDKLRKETPRQEKAKDKKRKMAEEICSSTTHSIRKTKMKLTEDYIEETFADFIEQNYHTEKLTEGNVVWIFEHEYVPALFEFYLEETYEISSLNEENTSNIYENEFIPALMKAYSLDESVNPGAIAGAAGAASTFKLPEKMRKIHNYMEENPGFAEKHRKRFNKAVSDLNIGREDSYKNHLNELQKAMKEHDEKEEMKESSAMDIYTSFLELQEKKSGSLRSHKKPKMDKVGEEDDDVNNDGKVNKTDDYLKYRRETVSDKIARKKKKIN